MRSLKTIHWSLLQAKTQSVKGLVATWRVGFKSAERHAFRLRCFVQADCGTRRVFSLVVTGRTRHTASWTFFSSYSGKLQNELNSILLLPTRFSCLMLKQGRNSAFYLTLSLVRRGQRKVFEFGNNDLRCKLVFRSNFGGTLAVLTEVLSGSPQSLHENTGIVPSLGHDHFLKTLSN
jgi:hypothetical protein